MKNKHLLSIVSVIVASAAASQAQTTIAGWDFDTIGTTAAPINSVAATSGSGTATQLGMNNSYTYANGEGPGSSPNCDIAAVAGASTGSGSFGWRVRGNGNAANSGAGVANGWNSQAPIATQGAEFVSASGSSGYNSITVTADIDTTTQAERDLAILYSLNGTSWELATITSAGNLGTIGNNTTSANTVSGNYVQLGTSSSGWNNQITATLGADANNAPNLEVEIVNASTGADDVNVSGAALNNSSGNWRYDNVYIDGVVATPEPSSLALISVGVAGLAAFRKYRKA